MRGMPGCSQCWVAKSEVSLRRWRRRRSAFGIRPDAVGRADPGLDGWRPVNKLGASPLKVSIVIFSFRKCCERQIQFANPSLWQHSVGLRPA